MTDADVRVERGVRALLERRRPTEAVPEALRAQILAIPDRGTTRVVLSRIPIRIGRGDLVGVAAAALFLVLLLSGALANAGIAPAPATPVGTPSASGLDPNVTGVGLVGQASDGFAWLAVVTTAAMAGLWSLAHRGWRRLLLTAVALTVVASGVWLSNQGGIRQGGLFGPTLGVDLHADPPAGSDGPSVYYVTAAARKPWTIVIGIYNESLLPIRLEGLVEESTADYPGPRWSAMWTEDDPVREGFPEDARPFVPRELAPGGYVNLFLVGRASACALGPSFRLDEADRVGYITTNMVRLAYSVVGWPHVAAVDLPVLIAEPAADVCPPNE
jgi:hypothetical protein